MSTFPPATLGKVSKAARQALAMTQDEVIKATGVPSWVLKFSEGRLMAVDHKHAKTLCDYYTSRGVDLQELAEHVAPAQVPDAPPAAKPLPQGFTHAARIGFLISEHITADVLDRLMDQMEANDERIAALMAATFERGFFGGISEDSEGKARELFATLAENYVLFRFLQGRNIIGQTRDDPKTIGDYLAQAMKDSPAMPAMGRAKAPAELAEASAE
jgi:hypothetical protein